MTSEAEKTYETILKNKQFTHAGVFRINVGIHESKN